MLKDLESQKSKAKETMLTLIDEYYEKYSERSTAPKFTIDVIEQLMLEHQTKLRETFAELNSELASSVAVESKKNALIAEDS